MLKHLNFVFWICLALAEAVPDGMVIQVKQKVNAGCGGGCGHHRDDWYISGPRGLKLWISAAGSYEDGMDACEDKGYELLAIRDEFLFADVIYALREEVYGLHDFWVDGSDATVEGDWRFSDGMPMPMGSPFWDLQYHRPSINGNKSCVALQGNRGYYWRDYSCYEHKHAICICSAAPHPPPTPPTLTCPENATQIYDRCVEFLAYQVDDFAEGREGCHGVGGDLLRLENPGILRGFAEYVDSHSGNWSEIIFVDGQLDGIGIFRFSDGSIVPMGSPYWQVGHPSGEADHLHFSTYWYLVNDVPCGALPPPPPETTTVSPTTPPPGPHDHRPMGPFDVACEVPPV